MEALEDIPAPRPAHEEGSSLDEVTQTPRRLPVPEKSSEVRMASMRQEKAFAAILHLFGEVAEWMEVWEEAALSVVLVGKDSRRGHAQRKEGLPRLPGLMGELARVPALMEASVVDSAS